ncbi:MAG: hypothetical protein HUJ74_04285 [Lachnospiraceae bacterium]|nr:hypothetical protein [Lachnospiraceae bacterium]
MIKKYLEHLSSYMVDKDYFVDRVEEMVTLIVKEKVKIYVNQRNIENSEESDGLNEIHQNLRILGKINMKDMCLIICSI